MSFFNLCLTKAFNPGETKAMIKKMPLIRIILGVAVVAASLLTHAANAAPQSVSCVFTSCTAEIESIGGLEVICDGRSIYRGPYELNTDFRTIQIQSKTPGGPHITTQSLPASGAPAKATLFVAGQAMDGACKVTLND
jgi:hypothetical protein